jgi:two-component system, NarL family, sensor histidine kinase LiaS
LGKLRATSAALAAGDLDQRVTLEGQDEFAQLGYQFNHMADQLGEQLQQLRDLADHNALLAEEAHALATVEERNRLARELHDAVKQQIFGLSLTAGSIRGLVGKDLELATERLTQLENQARDVHQEMDAIIQQLRPASLGDQGLAAALENLTQTWAAQTKIPVALKISGTRELPLVVEQALFRITQEALNNVHQHANANQVSIRVAFDLDEIQIQVEDNGDGFDPAAPRSAKSLGLRSMAERAAEIRGELQVEGSEGGGVRIAVRMPL